MAAIASTAKWQRRGDCRAEEILQATLEVLIERGYRATRLDDIASRAGVTKPLIYHYFKDKNDLVHRAMEWRLNQVLSEKRDAMQGAKSDWETDLRLFVGWQWARWSTPEAIRFHRMVSLEMRQEAPDLYHRWAAKAYGERSRFVQEILHEAKSHLRSDLDLSAASKFLVASLWSAVQAPSETDDQEAILETALDIFLAGIRRKPETR